MAERGCPGHPDLAEELRQYVGGALDLLQPWVDRVREQDPAGADPEPAVCASCPVCAVITVLRGGRSDLAVRLADHAAGVLAVLRAALDEGVGAAGAPRTSPPGPTRAEPSPGAESSFDPEPPSGPAWHTEPSSPTAPSDRVEPSSHAEPPGHAEPRLAAAEPPRAGPDQGRSGAEPRREAEPRPAPPRRRPAPRSGRGGRMVQHIEISRDGRGRPRGEPSRKPC